MVEYPAALGELIAFFESLPWNARERVDFSTVRGLQFTEPLFEFSGACAGVAGGLLQSGKEVQPGMLAGWAEFNCRRLLVATTDDCAPRIWQPDRLGTSPAPQMSGPTAACGLARA